MKTDKKARTKQDPRNINETGGEEGMVRKECGKKMYSSVSLSLKVITE